MKITPVNLVFLLSIILPLFPSVKASIFEKGLENYRSDYVSKSGVDLQRVQELTDAIAQEFTTLFKRYHNAHLEVQINWNDPTINLYAEQIGFSWFVHIYKGYFALEGMTDDAFTLSLCHELGHHLSGYPYKSSWSSAEGQADYFANQVCTTKMWEHDDNSGFEMKLPQNLINLCNQHFQNEEDQQLCHRKMNAGLDLAKVMAHVAHQEVTPELINLPPVDRTYLSHPQAQCRLNTFITASLCEKGFDYRVIPGMREAVVVPVPRERGGVNNVWARNQSMKYFCDAKIPSEKIAARPRCWFK